MVAPEHAASAGEPRMLPEQRHDPLLNVAAFGLAGDVALAVR